MTFYLVSALFIALGCAVIATDQTDADIDACMRRHPAWTDDTEAAIQQALAVGDDGRALADEAERWLKERTR
jgi:hypothetical protein